MRRKLLPISRIACPGITGMLERKHLLQLSDKGLSRLFIWISGPASSRKNTLAASYPSKKNLSCLWYQMDDGDADMATFSCYLGLAAKKAAPRNRKPPPLLTLKYLPGITRFIKKYFENLSKRLKPPFALVIDNYKNVSPDSAYREMIQEGSSITPEEIK